MIVEYYSINSIFKEWTSPNHHKECIYFDLILLFLDSIYSGGDKTSVKTLKSYKAYISHNKAKNPINLGAK